MKYLNKGYQFFQNKNSSFITSKRKYAEQNQYFSSRYFHRKLPNGETCERKWIMFSESKGSIFCFTCKLFSNNEENLFVRDGFSNWNKIDEIIGSHELSKVHVQYMRQWITYMQTSSRIDKSLVDAMESEAKYWVKVPSRVVAVIKFLAGRGHSFRGTEDRFGSSNNANYLGVLELIAEFDPFLKDHIDTHAQKGRGNVSYLSKTICEDIIELIAKKVLNHIKNEIITAKYWSIIVDSTPDISHVDQLSVIFRYYFQGHVYERFFDFLQIKSHKGRSLSNGILELLDEHNIDISNCRAQSYDNASNMSGKYVGLQACFKEKNNLAFYVPCVGHSLNLVGKCSVEVSTYAKNFFGPL